MSPFAYAAYVFIFLIVSLKVEAKSNECSVALGFAFLQDEVVFAHHVKLKFACG